MISSRVSEGMGVYTKNASVPAESTRAAAKKMLASLQCTTALTETPD